MNKNTVKQEKAGASGHYCPSKEDLSNWYDNGNDEQIKEHLDVCEPCEQTVGFYRKVDETVCMATAPTKYLAGDIAEACRNIRHETLHLSLWMRVVRIAAVAAVVCTVAGVVHVIMSPETGSDHPLISENSGGAESELHANLPSAPTASAGGVSETAPSLVDTFDSNHQLGPLRGNDLMTVSTSGNGSHGDAADRKAVLPMSPNVRHVWAVRDVKASRDALVQCLPKQVTEHTFPKVSDEMLVFEVSMTDAQLQKYVNDLQGKGWALVTREFPQPGQAGSVLLTGQSVNYHVELVKKED